MTPSDPTSAHTDLAPVGDIELATHIAAKLCHDFVSPSGAILSGLDLLNDPTAQDMREDAQGLIQQSANKLAALVHFCRVAFGAATSAERFTSDELHRLVAGMGEGGRAVLDWRVDEADFGKPAARALTNLAYLTLLALPMGGTASITTEHDGDDLVIRGRGEGNRARLKAEAVAGLAGQRLSEGLPGQWIQPYWLWLTVSQSNGILTVTTEEGLVEIVARMPA